MRFARLAAFVLGSSCTGLFAAACAKLPEYEANDCGNLVIDRNIGEECDGFAEPGTHCDGPGDLHACRFTCNPARGWQCPVGSACSRNGLCRRATGELELFLVRERFASPGRLLVGDFDIDGAPDVLMLGQADSFGSRPARIVYPSKPSASGERQALPAVIGPPAIGDVEDDDGGKDDIAFVDFLGVALLLGRSRQSPEFAVFPSSPPPEGTHLRGVLVDALPQNPGAETVTLLHSQGQPATLFSFGAGFFQVLTQLPETGGEDQMAGPIVAAQLDEGASCPQLVFAFRARKDVQIFTPCREGMEGIEWNVGGKVTSLSLPVAVDARPQVADLDLDGHLDVIVGANKGTYVAWGRGDGSFVSTKVDGVPNAASLYTLPPQVPQPSSMWEIPDAYPLAIADLNVDGAADFVLPGGVLMSSPQGQKPVHLNFGVQWTEAVVADFNGNGLLDVIAGSSDALDLDFLNNPGDGWLNPATLATEGFVSHLAVGDFDGDLLNDIAFEQSLQKGDDSADYLAIGFGAPFGPPESVGTIGHLDHIEQITAGPMRQFGSFDAIDDIMVYSEDAQADRDVVSVFTGRASRSIYAPSSLSPDNVWRLPLALAFGRLGDENPDIAALGVDYGMKRLQLLRIEGKDDGPPEIALPSAPLSDQFHSAEYSLGAEALLNFRYGAVMAGGDLDKDGTEEFVILAPYGAVTGRAAMVVAHYNHVSGSFTTDPEREVDAVLSVDSTLALHDVDGDDHLDAVLTTGSAENPGELLIFWGDAQNGLDVGRVQRISPGGQGVRAAACLPSRIGKGCELLLATEGGTFRLDPGPGRSPDVEIVPSLKDVQVYALGVGDFDRDGIADIALQTDQGLDIYRSVPSDP